MVGRGQEQPGGDKHAPRREGAFWEQLREKRAGRRGWDRDEAEEEDVCEKAGETLQLSGDC